MRRQAKVTHWDNKREQLVFSSMEITSCARPNRMAPMDGDFETSSDHEALHFIARSVFKFGENLLL